MSSFDPTSFLNSAVEGAMDTSRSPVPMGEYNAYIDKIDYKSFPISKGERAGQLVHKLEVLCKIMAPGNEEADNRTVRKDCVLDISPQGSLETGKGKNVDLGQIREATGLNDPSQPFAPNMLVGRQLRILVAHEPDSRNPGVVYPRVSRVAAVQ